MAGIGFELRKFLDKDNYLGLIGAYGFAALICSGPWLLSIASILLLIIIATINHIPLEISRLFQVLVVYLIAGSLIISSVFQHSYTRYLANQCYLNKHFLIVPTLNSIFLVLLITSGTLGILLIQVIVPSLTIQVKGLVLSSFIVLSMVWICTSVLSGMLAYKTIVAGFFFNFVITAILGSYWHNQGLLGLFSAFLIGQFSLFLSLVYTIYQYFPTNQLITFDFFNFKHTNKILILTGLLYNLGIWVDKFIFWFNPITGSQILGKLYASYVYDIPIFVAYLFAIPGMAIFLLNLETGYTESHQLFYSRVSGNNTLSEIQTAYRELVYASRTAILSAIKSQLFMLLVGITLGTGFFSLVNLPLIYLPLFFICLLAAGLNVVLWATLDIIFYQDRLQEAFILTLIFVTSNIAFTYLSIKFGIFYYGFGLVASLALTIIVSYFFLNHIIRRLQFETYMLRN